MLNIERRKRYSGLGYNITSNQNTLDLNFDLKSLDLMCCYVISENRNIRRSHLINMRNLFAMINMDIYRNDQEKLKRINFINKGLEGKLSEGLRDPYVVIKYINGGIFENDIIDPNNLIYELSNEELEWINKTVSESLKYSFIYNDMDKMIDVCTRFKAADYSSRGMIVKEFEELIDDFKTKFRRAKVESENEAMFSLRQGYFEDTVKDIHEQLSNPSARLICGMHGLNDLFGGGVENGRCYMFFGMAGTFKSGMLLSLAYQIKKYNKNIRTKDPSKRPAVVILTMENTVKETVERLFNMSTVSSNIRDFNSDQVINMLKTQGELYMNDESPIDIIIKYKPNGSVDTGYLYTLVEELEDEGVETICLIQDYVRRIRSAYKQPDIRLELGEIVNEFKVFASIKDIPVISAAQLNREASRTIETATQAKKSDLIRLLGRSNIGESMLMIDNLDWASLISIEYDSAGNKYLGFNRIKMRIRETERSIFYQPFVKDNGMKLIEDIYSQVPVLRDTLMDNMGNMELFNTGIPNNQSSNRHNSNSSGRRNIEDILAERNNRLYDDNILETPKLNKIDKFEFSDELVSSFSYSSNTINPISFLS